MGKSIGSAGALASTPGTLIHTEDGLVPIEEIKPDQLVWAEDPETGERALKRVVCLFRNEKYELVHLQINGESITTTIGHPFFVQGKGWLAAKELVVGDKLELLDGGEAYVDDIATEEYVEPVKVYNFEVEDFHTYFVGYQSILVHNICKGVGDSGWEGDPVWKQNVNTVKQGGTITSLKGGVPTKSQGIKLIQQAGGKVLRIEDGHLPPNPHTYPHINYVVNKVRGALQITGLE